MGSAGPDRKICGTLQLIHYTRTTMGATRAYKRGVEFPHEGFVQLAIEAHFRVAGFDVVSDGRVDLLCRHPQTGETWHIEAKGKTTQVGLDFRTGLGQLLQGMIDQESRHGLAVPDIPPFRAQVAKVSAWAVQRLGIHWLFVSADGGIHVVAPSNSRHTLVDAA